MENTIIRGKHLNIKLITLTLIVFFTAIPSLVAFGISYIVTIPHCDGLNWNWDWVIAKYGRNASVLTVTLHNLGWIIGLVTLCGLVAGCIYAIVFTKAYSNVELIVTDKRVYGKTSFGKRVDLPLDSISAVGTAMMKTIAVTTASGAIKFGLIANRDEVHNAISTLLVERQDKKNITAPVTNITNEIPQSNADELKKYKELLDSGVITQEEFDAKKKQLLGL